MLCTEHLLLTWVKWDTQPPSPSVCETLWWLKCIRSRRCALHLSYSGSKMTFMLCLTFHHVTSVMSRCLSSAHVWVSEGGAVGDTLSNGRRGDRTVSHRGPNVSRALCPVYTVISISSIYTPRHWKLSALGWCIDSTAHYSCLLPTTSS